MNIVQQLHDSPWRGVFHVTGGGASLLADLLAVPVHQKRFWMPASPTQIRPSPTCWAKHRSKRPPPRRLGHWPWRPISALERSVAMTTLVLAAPRAWQRTEPSADKLEHTGQFKPHWRPTFSISNWTGKPSETSKNRPWLPLCLIVLPAPCLVNRDKDCKPRRCRQYLIGNPY